MSVREIAAKFEAVCDCCKTSVSVASNSLPSHWTGLHIIRTIHDYQGAPCADGTVKLTLCEACAKAATDAMNAAFDKIRTALKGEPT